MQPKTDSLYSVQPRQDKKLDTHGLTKGPGFVFAAETKFTVGLKYSLSERCADSRRDL